MASLFCENLNKLSSLRAQVRVIAQLWCLVPFEIKWEIYSGFNWLCSVLIWSSSCLQKVSFKKTLPSPFVLLHQMSELAHQSLDFQTNHLNHKVCVRVYFDLKSTSSCSQRDWWPYTQSVHEIQQILIKHHSLLCIQIFN